MFKRKRVRQGVSNRAGIFARVFGELLPEKALLDWIYLTLQAGLRPSLDEIEFKSIGKRGVLAGASNKSERSAGKLLE